MEVCPHCGFDLTSCNVPHRVIYGENVDLLITVPVSMCVKCGLELHGWQADEVKTEAVCTALGRCSPREILSKRQELNMSVEEFAKATGFDAGSIYKWEEGIKIMDEGSTIIFRNCSFR